MPPPPHVTPIRFHSKASQRFCHLTRLLLWKHEGGGGTIRDLRAVRVCLYDRNQGCAKRLICRRCSYTGGSCVNHIQGLSLMKTSGSRWLQHSGTAITWWRSGCSGKNLPVASGIPAFCQACKQMQPSRCWR